MEHARLGDDALVETELSYVTRVLIVNPFLERSQLPEQRPHSSLNGFTPDQVYFNRLPEFMAA
jgi:hypothetical protein